MKSLITIILLSVIVNSLAQTKQQESEQRTQFIFNSNLPDNLLDFYDQKIRATHKINRELNPFYLRGDFDGDKKVDYALAVIESKTNKKGILIYHPTSKKYFFIGAGTSIADGHGDDYWWMDAWEVSDEKTVEQGVTKLGPPKLKGEAILVQKLESSSGLIYWTGTEYKWYQQGD